MDIAYLQNKALDLLKKMIETPSFSGEEEKVVAILEDWLTKNKIPFKKKYNNIWAKNLHFDKNKPTILLNSHHDTVQPNKGYTLNPFKAIIKKEKLYGLGSNDAGGCLVGLLMAFTYFYNKENLNYNLILAATGEEESSSNKGIQSVLNEFPEIDFAIVGEPTLLDLAIAEKGLLVLECSVFGTSGHAAHIQNNFSIYKAMKAIAWFEHYTFDKISEILGPVKMTVTQINAGKQHNVVPARTDFVVDIRINDQYTNLEILEIVKKNVNCEIKPRALDRNASFINKNHPIVKYGKKLGKKTYGSPTLSDQCHLKCPSLKLGPGDSLRSHSADEFIFLNEIFEGVNFYIKILKGIL